eukprot:963986-Amphidinium_carterae.1
MASSAWRKTATAMQQCEVSALIRRTLLRNSRQSLQAAQEQFTWTPVLPSAWHLSDLTVC